MIKNGRATRLDRPWMTTSIRGVQWMVEEKIWRSDMILREVRDIVVDHPSWNSSRLGFRGVTIMSRQQTPGVWMGFMSTLRRRGS